MMDLVTSCGLGFALGGIICLFIYIRYFPQGLNEVLFFPDEKMPCRTFYQELEGKEVLCHQINCQFAHSTDETTSFMRIMQVLQSAERRIDLCVYDFTETKLADLIIRKCNERIQIRIVTDHHVERKLPAPSPGGGGGDSAGSGGVNGGANDNSQQLVVISTGDSEPNQKNHGKHKQNHKNNNNNKASDDGNNKQQNDNQKGPNKQANHKGKQNKPQQQVAPFQGPKGGQLQQQQQAPPAPPVQMQRIYHKGDQIPSLQLAGIPIRINANNGPFGALMHNKFVIVDGKYLMMGSFNWTHSAITRNHEAILLTDNREIVSKFQEKFNNMWLHFQDRPADGRA